QDRPEIQGLKPLAIIGRAIGPEDEKVFALLRKRFDSLLQINPAPPFMSCTTAGIHITFSLRR
ncbi:MAG: hypothetical protein ACLFUS_14070, partial [Candidatus Sumerlaeia bacterium]